MAKSRGAIAFVRYLRWGSVFCRAVTPFTAVLRESIGDVKSPLRLMKDAWKLLPADTPPRSGIAPSLWQHIGVSNWWFWSTLYKDFSTTNPMYFLKPCRVVLRNNTSVPYTLYLMAGELYPWLLEVALIRRKF
ncbi:hypothetical protein K438DRAFT_1782320 [Mycena galopus ATCC 62051]|nr:hypothetical protein K438DRAFT_1782320 [Mycena galopus ATCC 62051]